jgi:hypothetical protein
MFAAAMQPEPIILIPPTHEQSVFTFQVQKAWSDALVRFLKERGITPWRPPRAQENLGPDGQQVIDVEVNDSRRPEAMEALLWEFCDRRARG